MRTIKLVNETQFDRLENKANVTIFKISGNFKTGKSYWIRDGYSSRLKGELRVKVPIVPRKKVLEKYVNKTGFDNVEQWMKWINRDGQITGEIETGYLLKLVKIEN